MTAISRSTAAGRLQRAARIFGKSARAYDPVPRGAWPDTYQLQGPAPVQAVSAAMIG